MAGSEIIRPSNEFQPTIGYKEAEKSPFVVTQQTNVILELIYHHVISDYSQARDYLHDYTIDYLKAAEKGSNELFNNAGNLATEVDLESREASSHVFSVFSWMHEMATSKFLPNGFSRKGMLRAPTSKDDYLERIKELKVAILKAAMGGILPFQAFEANPPLLRTYAFFEAGSKLPVRLNDAEKIQAEKQKEELGHLLDNIDFSPLD